MVVCVVTSVALHDYNLSWHVDTSNLSDYIHEYELLLHYRNIVRDFPCEIRYYHEEYHCHLKYTVIIPCGYLTYLLGGCS